MDNGISLIKSGRSEGGRSLTRPPGLVIGWKKRRGLEKRKYPETNAGEIGTPGGNEVRIARGREPFRRG